MSHRGTGNIKPGTVKPVRNKEHPSPARGADLAEREPPSFGGANLEGRTGRPFSFLDRRGGVGRLPSRSEGHLTPGPSGGWGVAALLSLWFPTGFVGPARVVGLASRSRSVGRPPRWHLVLRRLPRKTQRERLVGSSSFFLSSQRCCISAMTGPKRA
ncbi:hypothetical protein Q7C36_010394 [Tachysurus vachellii]|uniref:Uncharacterized protein n=1 Tax=Tachysurus vachellii TaxID=175792 RepID=A0AA88SWN7_TACVA|nr:hypothetical protein Q7C36_010394 [Tachysurus vachellii]